MKGVDFKKLLPYIGAIVAFIFIAYAYTPQVLSGKIVDQADISSWQGMAHEIIEHNEANPQDRTLWTNSMFGGMPATTIDVKYEGDITKSLYDVLFIGQRPASYFLISMIGGFLLMLAFGVNVYLAFLGAVAITFCSYNMQIMQVGHNTKMIAIAFMPWVLAAVVYSYRKYALWGGLFFALALSFQIKGNHPQITYYLAIIIFGYAIWQLCAAVKEKTLSKFIKTSLILLVTGCIGIATNINKLWPTYEYAEHTMRGGSELVEESTVESGKALKSGEKSRKGLDLEYATAWSYGIEETANLLIPNFNGGASAGELGRSSNTYKTLQKNGYAAEQVSKSLPLYWGPQPFTAGPMYMGAISIFLCALGFFVLRGGVRWWVGGVSLLALLLSWGYHMMPVSEFFFNFAPLYNKFRTVSMILVVLQILIPVMAVLAVNEILFGGMSLSGSGKEMAISRERIKKGFYWAIGITGGFCLIFALIPSLAGSFISSSDAQMPDFLIDSLRKDRAYLLRSDAIRSLLFIVISAAILWLGYSKKLKGVQAAAILSVLVLIDLWSVDKRYLNNSHFVSRREFNNAFAERPVDKIILQDKDLSYRVLDLSVNTFNDAYVSYHHKTIGGYSPAKLQRYQDLIERNISGEIGAISANLQGAHTMEQAQEALGNYPVLNMLNTRYIVINGNSAPLVNGGAYGNAWFVNSISKAANANKEIEMLAGIDPLHEAVIANNFINEEYLGEFYEPVSTSRGLSYWFESDSTATIELISYAPNRMVYKYSSVTPNVALFSEVFYAPGWEAVLYNSSNEVLGSSESGSKTGEKLNIFRANYILRGVVLPAGEGEIVFEFKPKSFTKGELYSRIASGLIVLLLCICLGYSFIRKRKE